jgi:hypothetical protein
MRSNKIVWSRISYKSNVERWNQGKKINYTKWSKNKGKKTLIRGQLKISFDMRFVAGCNYFLKKNWV